MEHLLKAIEKLAKLSGHSLSSSFLGDVYKYVRTGDTYDEPAGEKDGRVVAFGAVPAIAFSEAMGDLERISGKSQSKPEESADA